MHIKSKPLLSDSSQPLIEKLMNQMERVIIGKRELLEKCAAAILAGGHVILEDVPGTGKTMLVRALAKSADCQFHRIQMTPDVMPSDLTGVSVYQPNTGSFEFRKGPLFANIVLADELNRTSPKTQSALLEAMEEKRVTVDGETYELPDPFIVFATQNPSSFEGTYALPEAQLDRFLFQLHVGYPAPEEEAEMLKRMQKRLPPADQLRPVVMAEELSALQSQVTEVHVDDTLRQYIVSLAMFTRTHPDVELGASPRASINMMRAAQAIAFMAGRGYVIPDDIKKIAYDLFRHRIRLTPEARYAGKTSHDVIYEMMQKVDVPTLRFVQAR